MLTPHPEVLSKLFTRLRNGSHIDESSGCILWDKGINNYGYGLIYFCGKTRSIHRLVYTLLKNEPQEYVLHRCDNRRCWNIEHLWEGTAQDNSDDMVRKGRNIKVRS